MLLGATMLFSACGGNSENAEGGSSLSGSIQIDGSSTVYPITEAVAEEFRAEAPDVKVTVGVSGTGGGMKKFTRGDIDIVDASRQMKPSEDSLAQANGITYVELSVAYDGLTVVVHPENDWVKDITVAELKKIWEPAAQGTIKKWNQIRPEWPDKELHLYGPGVESGTYDYFTEAVVGESHSSRGDYTASEDDNVLVQGVSTDPYALGFFGFAYFEENQSKLKAVPVDDMDDSNGKGAILPSLETVKDGSYAPLSRPLYIYVNSKATARPEVITFINFYLDNAGELSQEVGYIPLPDELYKEQKQKFEQFAKGAQK
ncbi:PstS family phosphate ABC transporter substrate-binding protein [Pontibacter oryzae]|uniref:Phosphate-binding protein n=2 Tax=Pontibacter oryzae TaxID=2304593 RepID=A0A399S5H2_9BACT|nr:PstS family phosphate ABC transporter substrate-binding protein [Pontibacter oryzae]